MNLRKWLPSVVMAVIVIVVGVFVVSRLRDLYSKPRPSDQALRQVALDIGHDRGVPTFPMPQVVEKGVYASYCLLAAQYRLDQLAFLHVIRLRHALFPGGQ